VSQTSPSEENTEQTITSTKTSNKEQKKPIKKRSQQMKMKVIEDDSIDALRKQLAPIPQIKQQKKALLKNPGMKVKIAAQTDTLYLDVPEAIRQENSAFVIDSAQLTKILHNDKQFRDERAATSFVTALKPLVNHSVGMDVIKEVNNINLRDVTEENCNFFQEGGITKQQVVDVTKKALDLPSPPSLGHEIQAVRLREDELEVERCGSWQLYEQEEDFDDLLEFCDCINNILSTKSMLSKFLNPTIVLLRVDGSGKDATGTKLVLARTRTAAVTRFLKQFNNQIMFE
jgi:hypothetical protein